MTDDPRNTKWSLPANEVRDSRVLGKVSNLVEGDYTLEDGRCWLTVEGFSVRVRKTDDGIVVEVFANGREADTDPLAECSALDSECATTTTGDTMRVITSERAWRGEQSVDAEILLRFGTHTLRAKVSKDFYSDQGKYQLDRWNDSEWKQNAAPDLLSALESIWTECNCGGECAGTCDDAVKRRAIAKAQGGLTP